MKQNRKHKQSHNFVFDIKNHTLSLKEIKNQLNHIFNDEQRNWIEKIMVIDNDEIILIYEKNEMPSSKRRTTSHL